MSSDCLIQLPTWQLAAPVGGAKCRWPRTSKYNDQLGFVIIEGQCLLVHVALFKDLIALCGS